MCNRRFILLNLTSLTRSFQLKAAIVFLLLVTVLLTVVCLWRLRSHLGLCSLCVSFLCPRCPPAGVITGGGQCSLLMGTEKHLLCLQVVFLPVCMQIALGKQGMGGVSFWQSWCPLQSKLRAGVLPLQHIPCHPVWLYHWFSIRESKCQS